VAPWAVQACVAALSVVLAVAGARKLARPGRLGAIAWATPRIADSRVAARVLGCCELLLASACLALPAGIAAAVLAALYAGFGAVTAFAALRTPDEDCGCAGAGGSIRPSTQLALDSAAALVAGAAAVLGQTSAAASTALARDPRVALAALAVAPCWLLLARAGGVGGAADRLVATSAGFLETRISRRSALLRLAVAGSALSVAPLRYLLYPETALAVVTPGSCSSGNCLDGYTAFCCEINHGRNQCPENTYAGGWWMCTDYKGHQLCAERGIRYYVDCNRLPGHSFPGRCTCANGSCQNRRQNCNVFRYGQCNTQVSGVTEVVCRMVTCINPSKISGLNCGPSVSVDNAVCAHEAPCLRAPAAVQLPGAGGV
jgi:hypothetical protein